MTQKKKIDTPVEEAPDLYRLAEVLQMRRVEGYGAPNVKPYYECNLCHGRSDGALGEIQHRTDCPLNRLKHA